MKTKLSKNLRANNGDANTKVLFKNYYNMYYTGPIYIGANLQQMDVIWDTGSDNLIIPSNLCNTCTGEKYISSQSDELE